MVDALSPGDTAMLHFDDPTHRMMVTGVLWFAGPVDWDVMASTLVERLLERYPRFGQRLVEPGSGLLPLAAGWRDVQVHPEEQISQAQLPEPGDRASLCALVSELMSQPLDRGRPLWHLTFVDGFTEAGPGGCAIVARLHHAIADGIALAEVLMSVTDEKQADAEVAPRSAGRGLVSQVLDTGWNVGKTLVRHPGRVLEVTGEVAGFGATLGRLLALPGDPQTVFRGPLQTGKTVSWSPPAPLEEVKKLAKVAGGTVNDVLLAVAAGALRRYSLSRGETPVDIRAAVPVNLRMGASPVPRSLGNQFGLVVVPLPVGTAEPLARVHAVRTSTRTLKGGQQAMVTYGLVNALGTLPQPGAELAANLIGRKCSLIMTNVPGPSETVVLAGYPLDGILFWVPQLGGVALGLSIFSYAGSVTIGVASDASVIPDPEQISGALAEELADLREALTIEAETPASDRRRSLDLTSAS